MTHLSLVRIALELPPLPQLNKQECPSWTYLALGDGPQNAPLLATIVYLFKRKIILLKLLVTLKPGYFLLICPSSFHSYQWFWLLFKELYCCIDISSLYLTWLPKSPMIPRADDAEELDLPGSQSLIGILQPHLGLEGSGEIAVRIRNSVFKEYGQYLSLQVNIGSANTWVST